MSDTLLTIIAALGALNLAITIAAWLRHDNLAVRVIRLEANQANNLSHAETRQIYERLASIEGKITTTNQVMQTVQKHLLEDET